MSNLFSDKPISATETQHSKRMFFLNYINEKFNPLLVYYPACGWDLLPKQVFGTHHVIHLSLASDENKHGYLNKLGDGIKLVGDMKQSPLADESVDMILVNIFGLELTPETIIDFDRVLKPNGIVVIEGHNLERSHWEKYFHQFSHHTIVELPESFKSQVLYGVRKATDEGNDGAYVGSEEVMKDFVSLYQGYVGFQETLDYAIFQKR